MKAMILSKISDLDADGAPLTLAEMPDPMPGRGEILIRVSVCGVCHTELDEIEGRTAPPHLPVIPGHQVVGVVAETGDNTTRFKPGDRVGVGWIYGACGKCHWCLTDRENLCESFEATGRDRHGGYAEFLTVLEEFACAIPEGFTDSQAAPLLCAGAIGYRSLRLTGLEDGQVLGLTGFGASAHLVLKMAGYLYPRSPVLVFARSEAERRFALELGARWAGNTGETPPFKVDAVIDTTPVWKPVVEALRSLNRGGRLVINAIRKEEADKTALTVLDYSSHLWLEKEIKSVANVTRRDISEFLALAADMKIRPEVQEYPLEEANQALLDLKARKIRGAKVLKIRKD